MPAFADVLSRTGRDPAPAVGFLDDEQTSPVGSWCPASARLRYVSAREVDVRFADRSLFRRMG